MQLPYQSKNRRWEYSLHFSKSKTNKEEIEKAEALYKSLV